MNGCNSCRPIEIKDNNSINDMTFNGHSYFCTLNGTCKIAKLNGQCHITKVYNTKREYECICFDWSDECFWASSKSESNKLYKLDCCMEEVGSFIICTSGKYGSITGVSYDGYQNALMVTYARVIFYVEKKSENIRNIYSTKAGYILGGLSLGGGIIVSIIKDHKNYLELLNTKGAKIKKTSLANNVRVKNLFINPCKSFRSPLIELFLFENSRPNLCEWDIDLCDLGYRSCNCDNLIKHNCCHEKLPYYKEQPCYELPPCYYKEPCCEKKCNCHDECPDKICDCIVDGGYF